MTDLTILLLMNELKLHSSDNKLSAYNNRILQINFNLSDIYSP